MYSYFPYAVYLMNVYVMHVPANIIFCYDYDAKLQRDQLRELIFSNFLKLNLCISTVFIIKPEVAKTMMTTQ